jgi:hypothetical protein
MKKKNMLSFVYTPLNLTQVLYQIFKYKTDGVWSFFDEEDLNGRSKTGGFCYISDVFDQGLHVPTFDSILGNFG